MEQESDKSIHPLKSIPSITDKISGGFATVASIAVGCLVGDLSIRQKAYANLARHGCFKELQDTARAGGRTDKIMNLWSNVIPEAEQRSWRSRLSLIPSKTAKTLREIQHTYRDDVRQEFTKRDLVSYVDYWAGLHRNQKIEIGLRVLSAAAFAFAVTTYIGGYLHKKHAAKTEQDTAPQQSR